MFRSQLLSFHKERIKFYFDLFYLKELTFYNLSLLYSWSGELTYLVSGESTLLVSINARSCINLFIGNGIRRISFSWIVNIGYCWIHCNVWMLICRNGVFRWRSYSWTSNGHVIKWLLICYKQLILFYPLFYLNNYKSLQKTIKWLKIRVKNLKLDKLYHFYIGQNFNFLST